MRERVPIGVVCRTPLILHRSHPLATPSGQSNKLAHHRFFSDLLCYFIKTTSALRGTAEGYLPDQHIDTEPANFFIKSIQKHKKTLCAPTLTHKVSLCYIEELRLTRYQNPDPQYMHRTSHQIQV